MMEDSRLRRGLGVTFPIPEHGVAESASIIRGLEHRGYSGAWTSEVGSGDALAPLGYLAALTDTIGLGTAVIPAGTRPLPLLAMGAASVQALAGGRFSLGLGSSTPAIVEGWMGMPFGRPLTAMSDAIKLLRRVLAGERVDIAEGVRFRLQAEPTFVPILIGGLGPRMLHLAGTLADGVILTLASLDAVSAVLEPFRAGVEASGRRVEEVEVVAQINVAIDEDPVGVRNWQRQHVSSYGIVPFYNAYFRRQGFASEADALLRAWEHRSREEAANAVSDRMVDALTVTGTVRECRRSIRDLRGGGVTHPLISPISVVPEPDERRARVAQMLEALAESP